jgi:hypothetical protein
MREKRRHRKTALAGAVFLFAPGTSGGLTQAQDRDRMRAENENALTTACRRCQSISCCESRGAALFSSPFYDLWSRLSTATDRPRIYQR